MDLTSIKRIGKSAGEFVLSVSDRKVPAAGSHRKSPLKQLRPQKRVLLIMPCSDSSSAPDKISGCSIRIWNHKQQTDPAGKQPQQIKRDKALQPDKNACPFASLHNLPAVPQALNCRKLRKIQANIKTLGILAG